MTAKWFTEDMRNQLLGYGVRGGNTRTHLMQLKISGPGAIRASALCHGIQSLVLIDLSLDVENEAECRKFLNSRTRIEVGQWVSDALQPGILARLCPRCETIHAKRQPKEKL